IFTTAGPNRCTQPIVDSYPLMARSRMACSEQIVIFLIEHPFNTPFPGPIQKGRVFAFGREVTRSEFSLLLWIDPGKIDRPIDFRNGLVDTHNTSRVDREPLD